MEGRIGGLAYLVRDGETRFTIPDQESEELCEKISWLLNDPLREDRKADRGTLFLHPHIKRI